MLTRGLPRMATMHTGDLRAFLARAATHNGRKSANFTFLWSRPGGIIPSPFRADAEEAGLRCAVCAGDRWYTEQ